jgi:hypothetical protein
MTTNKDKRSKTREPEEDLTKGPTPETRPPDPSVGHHHDISEGPTPEVRDAERADEHAGKRR